MFLYLDFQWKELGVLLTQRILLVGDRLYVIIQLFLLIGVRRVNNTMISIGRSLVC